MARRELEADIESKVRAYAKRRGWWVAKFVSPGLRGVPDRIFIRNRHVIFIELKKPGEEPTTQQEIRHREMRAAGARIYWVTSLAEAMEILY